jgi:hypothetical protein
MEIREILASTLSSITTVALVALLVFLAKNWFLERLKHGLQKEHGRYLDELHWNRKAQEQAARVAEYMAFVRMLNESSSPDDYIRANQLSWELAMWLPDEIYRQMTYAIVRPDQKVNELSVVLSVRKLLLGDGAGNLVADHIAHHAPGIGRKNNPQGERGVDSKGAEVAFTGRKF